MIDFHVNTKHIVYTAPGKINKNNKEMKPRMKIPKSINTHSKYSLLYAICAYYILALAAIRM